MKCFSTLETDEILVRLICSILTKYKKLLFSIRRIFFFFFFYELRKNKINISKPLIEKKKLLTKTNTRGEASRISLYAYICVYTVLALKMTRLRKRGVYATRTKSYVILRPINIDLNLASKLNMLNIYV